MKRMLAVGLACALLVGCVMIFASCGISGKYEANLALAEVSYEFKGSKVIVEIDPLIGEDVVLNGSYKLGIVKYELED